MHFPSSMENMDWINLRLTLEITRDTAGLNVCDVGVTFNDNKIEFDV